MSSLPSKLFFRIGEVAGLVGVEPHVLRYWEREFRSIRPTKSAKGQRVYSRKDVENLLRVRNLLYRDGFTIAGAKKRLLQGVGVGMDSVPAGDVVPRDTHACGDFEVDSGDNAEAAEPLSAPGPNADVGEARKKLTALRGEVEAFLGELEAPALDRRERA